MKSNLTQLVGTTLFLFSLAIPLQAQSTAFSYQGRLNDGTGLATGTYDFRFTIYDAGSGGAAVAGPVTNSTVAVSNGLFVTVLDFGAAPFTGAERWLQIAVRTNAGQTFTNLTPRQPLTSAPYAVRALNASTATSASSVSASAVGTVGIADGSIIAADLSPALAGNTFWRLDGNAGTVTGLNFLGTTDNQPLELKVNGTRAFRLEPDPRGFNAANVVGGHPENSITNGIGGSVIVGGGFAGGPNRVEDNSHGAFVGAGSLNVVRPNSSDAVIAGGFGNSASGYAVVVGGGQGNTSTGYTATVAGGFFNTASGDGASVGGGGVNLAQGLNAVVAGGAYNTNVAYYAAIVGGLDNDIEAGSSLSLIGGGWLNLIQAGADQAVIAGGNANRISSGARYPFIGGGWANHVQNNATAAFIGGGTANTNSGGGAFIGGGVLNRAENFDTVIVGGGANVNGGYRGFIGGGEGNVISNTGSFITVSGGRQNVVSAGASTIAGGSENIIGAGAVSSAINGGLRNTNLASQSVIGGGGRNMIEGRAIDSLIAGGILNTIQSNAFRSTISGGQQNTIWTNAEGSTIGGGTFNDIEIGAIKATIGGGEFQTIHESSSGSTISGGSANTINSNSILATLAGGQLNLIRTASRGATLSGGVSNIVGGRFAVVPGGLMNSATGAFSFAGGLNASALHNGAFVWADSTSTNFASTASNQFNVRARGGVRLETDGAGMTLDGVNVLSGIVPNASLAGTYSSALTLNNANNAFTGAFSGNGGALSNVNAATLGGVGSNGFWRTSGNVGTTPTSFLGTMDNQPFTLKVNGATALRIDPTATVPHSVGGLGSFLPTFIGNNVRGAVVAGGNAPAGPVSGFGAGDFHAVFDSDGVIGGGFGNKVGTDNGDPDDAPFATVAGGVFNGAASYAATAAGGDGNFAGGSHSSVVGGFGNRAMGANTFVGGGVQNANHGSAATISGGFGNRIDAFGSGSTIGGGSTNRIVAFDSTISGGLENTIESGYRATIGGGEHNTIQEGAGDSTIGGGFYNMIGTNAGVATIGGGGNNRILPNGQFGTIPGGYLNTAANMAFAAGFRAKANHTGSFVWSDSQNTDFASTGFNQFLLRAAGGVGINTATPGAMLQVGDANTPNSQGMIRLASRAGIGAATRHWDIGVPEDDFATAGKFFSFVIDDPQLGADPEVVVRWDTGNVGIGVTEPSSRLHVGAGGVRCEMGLNQKFSLGGNGSFEIDAPGILGGRFIVQNGGNVGIGTANPQQKLHVIGNIVASGSICANNGINCASDRNVKAGFKPVDSKAILEKVAAMPITRWHYTNDTGTAHLGPIAQDFHAAFGVGPDDKHITTIDADGVALAAIQGLNQKLEEKLSAREARIEALETTVAQLKELLTKLTENNLNHP